jgi:hypothetical protein
MPPDRLGHATPIASTRTTGRVLADAFVGLAQVGFGLVACLIVVVLTESIWGRGR